MFSDTPLRIRNVSRTAPRAANVPSQPLGRPDRVPQRRITRSSARKPVDNTAPAQLDDNSPSKPAKPLLPLPSTNLNGDATKTGLPTPLEPNPSSLIAGPQEPILSSTVIKLPLKEAHDYSSIFNEEEDEYETILKETENTNPPANNLSHSKIYQPQFKSPLSNTNNNAASDDDLDSEEDDEEFAFVQHILNFFRFFKTLVVSFIRNIFSNVFAGFNGHSYIYLIFAMSIAFVSAWILSHINSWPTSSSSTSFPKELPADFEAVGKRIMAVESSIESLAKYSKSFDHRAIGMSADLDKINKDVNKLFDKLGQMDSDYSLKFSSLDHQLHEFEDINNRLEMRLGTQKQDLEEAYKSFPSSLKSNSDILLEVIDGLAAKINMLTDQYGDLLKQLEGSEDSTLQIIQNYLPSRLAVSFDPSTGKIQPLPEFLDYLNNIFRDQMDEIELQIDRIQLTINRITSDESDVDNDLRHELFQLKELVNSKQNDNIGPISQDWILQSIRDHFESLKAESTVEMAQLRQKNENLEQTVDEEMTLRTKLEQRLERDHKKYVALTSVVDKLTGVGSSSTSGSMPDFAALTSGGRVDPYLTSNKYNPNAGLPIFSRMYKTGMSLLGFGVLDIKHPSITLSDSNTDSSGHHKPGHCWAFNGQQGLLGIQLGAKIIPSNFAVEHISPLVSTIPSSAPQDISFWTFVEDESTRTKISNLFSQQHSTLIPKSFVKVAKIIYDINSNKEMQIFSVPETVLKLLPATDKVIFQIETNWGNNDYTCIYRVRVFGDNPADQESILGYDSDQGELGFGDDEVL